MSKIEIISIKEACEVLRCKRTALYELIESQGLPALNISQTDRKQYRILKDDFIAWMRNRSRQNQKPVTPKCRSIAKPLVEIV